MPANRSPEQVFPKYLQCHRGDWESHRWRLFSHHPLRSEHEDAKEWGGSSWGAGWTSGLAVCVGVGGRSDTGRLPLPARSGYLLRFLQEDTFGPRLPSSSPAIGKPNSGPEGRCRWWAWLPFPHSNSALNPSRWGQWSKTPSRPQGGLKGIASSPNKMLFYLNRSEAVSILSERKKKIVKEKPLEITVLFTQI